MEGGTIMTTKRLSYRVLGTFLLAAWFFGNMPLFDVPTVYAAPKSSNVQASQQVDINDATFEELQDIRGIGPAIAKRIISHRNEFGSFDSLDELAGVRGIGGAKLQKIRGQITV